MKENYPERDRPEPAAKKSGPPGYVWVTALVVMIVIAGAVTFVIFRKPKSQLKMPEKIEATFSLEYKSGRGEEGGTALQPNAEGVYVVPAGKELQVTMECPREGCAAVMLLSQDLVDCWPPFREAAIVLQPDKKRTWSGVTMPKTPATLLVLISERTAANVVRRALPEHVAPDEVDGVVDRVMEALAKDEQSWAAMKRLTLRPE